MRLDRLSLAFFDEVKLVTRLALSNDQIASVENFSQQHVAEFVPFIGVQLLQDRDLREEVFILEPPLDGGFSHDCVEGGPIQHEEGRVFVRGDGAGSRSVV